LTLAARLRAVIPLLAMRFGGRGADRAALERRLAAVLLVVMAALALLVLRLGYLQVVRGGYYEGLSRGNRIRLVSLTAPRGDIIDRDGETLATTRPAYAASLVYMGQPFAAESLDLLEAILSLEPGRIDTLLERWSSKLYMPIRLKNDISASEHSRLEEHRNELPGLVIEVIPIREYPAGQLAAHVLGRVGFLNTETSRQSLLTQATGLVDILTAADRPAASYELDEIVGMIGLERYYDSLLRGVDGAREVEVNSRGTPTRVERETSPQAGLTLGLTLDLTLQAALEQSLQETIRQVRAQYGPTYATSAAAVVLDVKTGGVLAMANYPTFDPNWSASGAVDAEFLPLLEEFNRSIQGLYIPGSTYKMITAVAALEEQVVGLGDDVWCGGGYRLGNSTIGCWVGPPGHGMVNITEAIQGSCNTYFIEAGVRLRALAQAQDPNTGMIDLLAKYASGFGLAGPTGIDLPFERSGTAPQSSGKAWLLGEDVQCAIGQSRQEYSPLQLASYVATLANNGVRLQPHVVQRILEGEATVWEYPRTVVPGATNVAKSTFDIVKNGMLAVTRYGGTAYAAFSDVPVAVGAKTGTAQTNKKPNDGLFVGFAPFDNPEIAFAIVVKNGDSGSLSCAPVAREIVLTHFGYSSASTAAPSTVGMAGEEVALDAPQ